MIIDIRGTNGSGKTYIVRRLMEEFPPLSTTMEGNHVTTYRLPHNIQVIGSYKNPTGTGTDSLSWASKLGRNIGDVTEEYVRLCYPLGGTVIFEGMITSGSWTRWYNLAQEIAPHPYVWCFFDTPIEVCIERVFARSGRESIGNYRKIRSKFGEVERIQAKALTAGKEIRVFHWQTAYEDFIALLKEKGCIPI